MKKRLISKDEWMNILINRGTSLTGHPVHFHMDRVYYWPHGSQPSMSIMDDIASKNPEKAAKLYLNYKKGLFNV